MSLNELAFRIYQAAKAKGFHPSDGVEKVDRETVALHLMNLHSEVSEAWEAFRENRLFSPCDKADAMYEKGITPLTCIEEELSDIIIRALDTAYTLGVDIDRAIEAKRKYNATRPHLHGGKAA